MRAVGAATTSELGQKQKFSPRAHVVRFTPKSGHQSGHALRSAMCQKLVSLLILVGGLRLSCEENQSMINANVRLVLLVVVAVVLVWA
jgi:hypothetical protein